MASISDVVKFYTDRMANIYRSKPKASAQMALFVKQMLADNLVSELNPAYDIDLATGAQLDVIGKYVGVSRDVQVPDTRPYFGFVTADYPAGDQNLNGFTIAASVFINAQGIWYRCAFVDQSTSQLPDYSYAQLIKIKIATNFSDDTMQSVQEQISGFFPGQLQLRDNQDMTMSYFFGSKFQLPISVLKSYLPRPMGVNIDVSPAIGFDVLVDGVETYSSQTAAPEIHMAGAAAMFEIINRTSTPFTIIAVAASDPVILISGFTPALPALLADTESLTFTLVVAGIAQPSSLLDIYVQSSLGIARYEAKLVPPENPPSPELRFYLDVTPFASGDTMQIQVPSGTSTSYIVASLDNLDHVIPTSVSGITCSLPGSHIGKDVSMTPLVYPFVVPGSPVTRPPVVFELNGLTGDDTFDIQIINNSSTPIFTLHVHISSFGVRANYEELGTRVGLATTVNQNVIFPRNSGAEPMSMRVALATVVNQNVIVARNAGVEPLSQRVALATTTYLNAIVARNAGVEPLSQRVALATTTYFLALVSRNAGTEPVNLRVALATTTYHT